MHINADFIPFLVTVVTSVAICLLTYRLTAMRYFTSTRHRQYLQQAIRVSVAFIAIIAIVLSLPVSNSVRGQMVTLIGVLISGVFAFASTTVVANLMAGLMLRVNKPFRTGDFIQVDDHFGRVIELGLFESEIQSEQSTIIALPNTYLISNPIEVTSPDAAIVSAEVSLGYDVHHDVIESVLRDAATKIGLTDPFTQVLTLGDFSVNYRVSGVLDDVKQLLTTRSNLHRAVLDALHQADVEIVSPNFMNQRQITDAPAFIARPPQKKTSKKEKNAEEVVFGKADEAEKVEKLIARLNERIDTLTTEIKSASGEEKTRLQAQLANNQARLAKLIGQDNA